MRREVNEYGVSTASYAEMIWTIANLLGAIVCAWLLRDAYGDLHWLHEEKLNGERRLLALDSVVGEAIYVAVLAAFTFVGMWAMCTPSPNDSGKPTQLSIMTALILILAAITFTTHAFLRRYWRDEYIRRRLTRRGGQVSEPPVTITIDTTDVDSVEVTTQVIAKDAGAP